MKTLSEQTIITIDQGNSLVKMALFRGTRLLKLHKLDKVDRLTIIKVYEEFVELAGNHPISYAILSSVAASPAIIHNALKGRVKVVDFSIDQDLPLNISYQTPNTLGNDRIVGAIAAANHFPNFSVLSIDAGTCITYDLITASREYLGGGISPGIKMRLKAMNTFTGNLPLVEPEHNPPLIGRTTNQSILSGVINGVVQEVNGIIEQYMLKYPKLKIILTGGDANYFDKKLKYNIFANPNLVLIGLRDIILHHVEK